MNIIDPWGLFGGIIFPSCDKNYIEGIRENIATVAKSHENEKKWSVNSFSSLLNGGMPGSFKCNAFVYDILREVGINVRKPNHQKYFDQPPLAGQWANRGYDIPGFRILGENEKPIPGDIAAISFPNHSDYTGHIGIVTGEDENISQSSHTDKVSFSKYFSDKPNTVYRRFDPCNK